MKKALEGVRVLDLTRVISGPFCTSLLADFGAEVIKVEGHGEAEDQFRLSDEVTMVGRIPLVFIGLNRGKKGLTLNLKSDQGKEIFKALAKRSDVVVENFRPRVMDRLGLGYSVLREINPRLVYASISGFGKGSPHEGLPSYDLIAQAMGGLMSITGEGDGPPMKAGNYIGDRAAGLYAAFAICAALLARSTHGMGQYLETSLLDSIFSILDIPLYAYLATNKLIERMGNCDPSVYPFDLFQAADGHFACGAYDPITFRRLCETIGRPELIGKEAYRDFGSRWRHRAELKEIIEAWSCQRTVKEVVDILQDHGVPAGPVLNIGEVVESEHIRLREMLVEVVDPEVGKVRIPASAVKMSQTPATIEASAPRLGEHTDEILRDLLGYNDDEIRDLRDRKVI